MWAERLEHPAAAHRCSHTGGATPGLFYLVLHGFLLADQLGAQDQHLLLTDVQLLTGGGELLQEHLVSRRARSSGAGRRIPQKTLPHLCQVVFQLLVLGLELLTLRSQSVGVRGAGLLETKE